MPVRIHDIARKLGIETGQVLAKAKEMGIPARAAISSLDKITGEYLEDALRCDLAATFQRGFLGMGLGNFKAFAETQDVPIRPLTLIFGANSSGKSSVLHGLLLARHGIDTGELDVTRTAIGGDSVDLGGFQQYVHRREASRRVELIIELDNRSLRASASRFLEKYKTTRVTLTLGMPLDNEGRPQRGDGPRLVNYEVECDRRSIVRLSARPDKTMRLDRLDEEALLVLSEAVLLSNTTTQSIGSEGDRKIIRETMEGLIPMLRFTYQRMLPDELVELVARGHDRHLLPVGRANRAEELVNATWLLIPGAIGGLVRDISATIESQLERICYLGPLRSFPPRHLAFAETTDPNWRAGGGYAWDVVRRDEKVRAAVNGWLGATGRLKTPYELVLERLFTASDAQKALESGLGSIAADMERKQRQEGISQEAYHFPFDSLWDDAEYARTLMQDLRKHSDLNPMDELVLIDRRTNTSVTHRDVGIGVSQVLPVLVHAYADKGSIVAIEQPEIHLHPALQAELGDVFIESALGENKNTFLLETHSEHLILRVLRRVRETTDGKLPAGATPVRPEDVSVVFVEPTAQGSVVRQLPVTPDGDFEAPWPGGFFAERLADLP